MAITSIQRDWAPNLCIVRIITTNTLAEVAQSNYLTEQSENISFANNGPFTWLSTDFVLVLASDGFNFFTLNPTFTTLAVASVGTGGGGSGTVTQINSGVGLTGGPITTTGSLSYAPIAANSFWANTTGGAAVPAVTSLSIFLLAANNLNDVASKPTSRTNLQVPATSVFGGDPNGNVAGAVGDFCINTSSGNALYMCTTAGNAASAVWTLQGGSSSGPIVDGAGVESAQGGDASAVGNNSFAFGSNVNGAITATGLGAIAFGTGSTASGDYSFVSGDNARSSGDFSFSFGSGTTAASDFSMCFGGGGGIVDTGSEYSLAFGFGASIAGSCPYSFSWGNAAFVTNPGSWSINDGVLVGQDDTGPGQFNISFTNGMRLNGGSLNITTAGSGLAVKEGANGKQGAATLIAGTVTISTTSVTANSRIFLTGQDSNVTGILNVSDRNAASDFTILSSEVTDSGVVAYQIFEPAA